jgi:hypothetical protein
MSDGKTTHCFICDTQATQILGFSAPMGLPGTENIDFGDTAVTILEGWDDECGFMSYKDRKEKKKKVYEMNSRMRRDEERTGISEDGLRRVLGQLGLSGWNESEMR